MLTVCVPTESAGARRANTLMWSLSKDEGAASKKELWQLLDAERFKPLVCCLLHYTRSAHQGWSALKLWPELLHLCLIQI